MPSCGKDFDERKDVAASHSVENIDENDIDLRISSIEIDGENSYGTNNQVEGVDEGDLIKSNGHHIFVGI